MPHKSIIFYFRRENSKFNIHHKITILLLFVKFWRENLNFSHKIALTKFCFQFSARKFKFFIFRRCHLWIMIPVVSPSPKRPRPVCAYDGRRSKWKLILCLEVDRRNDWLQTILCLDSISHSQTKHYYCYEREYINWLPLKHTWLS